LNEFSIKEAQPFLKIQSLNQPTCLRTSTDNPASID
jgi:hypothetical protein